MCLGTFVDPGSKAPVQHRTTDDILELVNQHGEDYLVPAVVAHRHGSDEKYSEIVLQRVFPRLS